ncbi:MAG TPA: hypothetical protein GX393_03550 [Firmicutes bacterium]|jgi:hypothetical protein|nr:hypothetical protein [Bacillota bacterium]
MIPSPSFIASVLAGLMARAGVLQLTKHGYMPQSTYIKAALKALEKDDLDEAVHHYKLATKRWRPSQKTEIAEEIISSAIGLRIAKLQNRLAELEPMINPSWRSLQYWRNLLPRNRQKLEELREEQRGLQEAIQVLSSIQEKLKENA